MFNVCATHLHGRGDSFVCHFEYLCNRDYAVVIPTSHQMGEFTLGLWREIKALKDGESPGEALLKKIESFERKVTRKFLSVVPAVEIIRGVHKHGMGAGRRACLDEIRELHRKQEQERYDLGLPC